MKVFLKLTSLDGTRRWTIFAGQQSGDVDVGNQEKCFAVGTDLTAVRLDRAAVGFDCADPSSGVVRRRPNETNRHGATVENCNSQLAGGKGRVGH